MFNYLNFNKSLNYTQALSNIKHHFTKRFKNPNLSVCSLNWLQETRFLLWLSAGNHLLDPYLSWQWIPNIIYFHGDHRRMWIILFKSFDNFKSCYFFLFFFQAGPKDLVSKVTSLKGENILAWSKLFRLVFYEQKPRKMRIKSYLWNGQDCPTKVQICDT